MSESEIIKRPVDSDEETQEGETIGKDAGKKSTNAGQAIKKSAWMAFSESFVLLIFGILLIIWPTIVVKAIAYTLGAYLAIRGGYKIMNYFMVKGQKDYFNNNLLWGVVSVLAGVTVIVLGEDIMGAFRIVIGIWIIYESLVRMNTSIKLNSAGIPAWRYTLIVALAMLFLGIFVTFNTGAVTQLIGGMMIISGVIGIIGDVMFMQYVGALVEKLSRK